MRTLLRAALLGCLIGIAGAGCATKGFVRESVGDVNTKVEALGQAIEATQEQTKGNAARIEQVDQKASLPAPALR